jgi:acetyltransferase-like isoleucine patch superfamily enzyme
MMTRKTVEAQKELFSDEKSASEKYCDLIVGRRGLRHLLVYEFINATAVVPGAFGLWLRSRLYPRLLGRCGRNVVFGHNVTLRHPHRIEIGDNVVIDDNCLLDAKGYEDSGIKIGSGVFLGRNSILSCKNGEISLGEGVNIGFNCEIFSASNVTLGAETMVAAYSYFIGGGHDFDQSGVPVLRQGRSSKGISVGVGAWFGAGCRILDGVTVGEHAVIGAGAVVPRDIPAHSVAAGIPARVLRDRREEG